MIFNIAKVEVVCTVNLTMPDGAEILQALVNLGDQIMSSKEEVLAAVEAERVEVLDRIAAAEATVQAKIDAAVAVGDAARAADFSEILVAVQGIYVPAAVEPPAEPVVE